MGPKPDDHRDFLRSDWARQLLPCLSPQPVYKRASLLVTFPRSLS